jgi:hypothetical protein
LIILTINIKEYIDNTSNELNKITKDLREFGKARGKSGVDVYDYFITAEETL